MTIYSLDVLLSQFGTSLFIRFIRLFIRLGMLSCSVLPVCDPMDCSLPGSARPSLFQLVLHPAQHLSWLFIPKRKLRVNQQCSSSFDELLCEWQQPWIYVGRRGLKMEIDLVPDCSLTIFMTLAKMQTILTGLFPYKVVLNLLWKFCECDIVLVTHMDGLASVRTDWWSVCFLKRKKQGWTGRTLFEGLSKLWVFSPLNLVFNWCFINEQASSWAS